MPSARRREDRRAPQRWIRTFTSVAGARPDAREEAVDERPRQHPRRYALSRPCGGEAAQGGPQIPAPQDSPVLPSIASPPATKKKAAARTSTMSNTSWNRRRLLAPPSARPSSAALAGSAGRAGPVRSRPRAPGAGQDVTVGLIYVGPRGDYGWNQAHAVAAKALKAAPGVKVVEEENVPETVAVRKTIEGDDPERRRLADLRTSFGYFDPFMVDMAKKYPEASQFRHPTTLWSPDKHPAQPGRLLLLPRPGPLRERHRGRPVDQDQQDRLYRGQADRHGAAQHQRFRDGRAEGQPERGGAAGHSPATGRCPCARPRPPTP